MNKKYKIYNQILKLIMKKILIYKIEIFQFSKTNKIVNKIQIFKFKLLKCKKIFKYLKIIYHINKIVFLVNKAPLFKKIFNKNV